MGELSKAEWLLPAPSVGMGQWVEDGFVAAKLPIPRTVVQTDTSTPHFAELIRRTNLVTAVMTPMLASQLASGLVEIPFTAQHAPQPLVLLSRRASYLSPAVVALRNALQQEFAA